MMWSGISMRSICCCYSRTLTRCWQLLSSADNLCNQFWSRWGPTKRRASSGSKLFDTLMVVLKEFFFFFFFFFWTKTNKSKDDKKHAKLHSIQIVKSTKFFVSMSYCSLSIILVSELCSSFFFFCFFFFVFFSSRILSIAWIGLLDRRTCSQ